VCELAAVDRRMAKRVDAVVQPPERTHLHDGCGGGAKVQEDRSGSEATVVAPRTREVGNVRRIRHPFTLARPRPFRAESRARAALQSGDVACRRMDVYEALY